MLHPTAEPRRAYVTRRSRHAADRWWPRPTTSARSPTRSASGWSGRDRSYRVLGTDGYGRSDSRRRLRRFFEVDRHYVALAALKELADARRDRAASVVAEAIERYHINPEAPMPTTV